MTDPTASATLPSHSRPWTAGRVAFTAFRAAWSIILAQPVAGWLEADRGIPFMLGVVLVLPACWWLSGLFRRWGRRTDDKRGGAMFATFIRFMWSGIAAAMFPQLFLQAVTVPAGWAWLAWVAGAGLGVGWFVSTRRLNHAPVVLAFFVPATLPLGMPFVFMAFGVF